MTEPEAPAPAQVGDKNIAPTTTAAADLVTAGQRRINVIWETTQAFVAIAVTATTLYVAGWLATHTQGGESAFLLLSNAFFLVIGAYITRTNHTKIGGVAAGEKGR
jgi:hypothetical protein